MIDRQEVSQYLGPMTLITKRRMFLASLASAIALFVVPFILVSMEMPYSRPDGTPDNAPLRATAILVLISPVIFVLFSVVTFVLAVFFAAPRSVETKGTREHRCCRKRRAWICHGARPTIWPFRRSLLLRWFLGIGTRNIGRSGLRLVEGGNKA